MNKLLNIIIDYWYKLIDVEEYEVTKRKPITYNVYGTAWFGNASYIDKHPGFVNGGDYLAVYNYTSDERASVLVDTEEEAIAFLEGFGIKL
jgi:hypothetical protein